MCGALFAMFRQLRFYLCVLLLLGAALVWLQLRAGPFLVDNYLDQVISRLQSRLTDISVRYEILDKSSFAARDIRFYITIYKDFLGERKLDLAFDVKMTFSLLKVIGVIESIDYYGNYSEVFEKHNVAPIVFRGAFTISPQKNELAIKSSTFSVPLADGRCIVGENAVFVSLNGYSSADVTLSSSGVRCVASVMYNDTSAYDVRVEGMAVDMQPEWTGDRISLDAMHFRLEKFDAFISTIYALGFEPEERVIDSSLADRFVFEDVGMTFGSRGADHAGFSTIDLDLVGNYAIGMPHIKNGLPVQPYRLDDLNLNFRLSKINIFALRDLLRANDDNFMAYLLRCISPSLKFELNNFSFRQHGASTANRGHIMLRFDRETQGIAAVDADFNLRAEREVLEHLARELGFVSELEGLVEKGAVSSAGGSYSTRLRLHGNTLSLNGVEP